MSSCSQFVAGNLSWSGVVDPCFCVHNRSLDDADAQLPYYEIHYCALPCAPAVRYVLAALGLALLFPSKKTGALTKCPATAWPVGKPMLAKPADYPRYDHVNDPKGSFVAICDMLIAEVKDELPKM